MPTHPYIDCDTDIITDFFIITFQLTKLFSSKWKLSCQSLILNDLLFVENFDKLKTMPIFITKININNYCSHLQDNEISKSASFSVSIAIVIGFIDNYSRDSYSYFIERSLKYWVQLSIEYGPKLKLLNIHWDLRPM